jgi:hypothetical protein
LLAPLGILYVVLDRSQSTGRNYFLASGISLIVFAIINPQGIAGRARQLRLGLARRWAAARAR